MQSRKNFENKNPLYFLSVLQSHETCLKLMSVHAFTKCNTLARPVKQDDRVRSAGLTSFCLIMFNLYVLMQERPEMRNIPKTQGQPQLLHQARLLLLGRHAPCLRFCIDFLPCTLEHFGRTLDILQTPIPYNL